MFAVTPNRLRVGDKIAVITDNGIQHKPREVKRIAFCEGSPECIHLDHECYDMRFSTFMVSA